MDKNSSTESSQNPNTSSHEKQPIERAQDGVDLADFLQDDPTMKKGQDWDTGVLYWQETFYWLWKKLKQTISNIFYLAFLNIFA